MSSSIKLVRAHTAVLLLVSMLAAPAVAAPTPAEKSPVQAAISKIRIDNFGQVNANYYRGAQPKNGDYADLAALGIKTLINLTSDDARDDEAMWAERSGMSYVQIPMTTHTSPTIAQMVQFLQIVTDPSKQPVYVHCVGGRHRTGVMTAIYRMTQDGWSAAQAFQEMKQYKFGADLLHREFKEFVFAFTPAAINITAAPSEQPHLAPVR